MLHLPVPGAADVVILPVATDDEGDNANTDGGTAVDHGNIRSLVGIFDIACIHPAPVFARNHVAPAVILHASLNIYSEPGFQDRHDGIISGGSGAQVGSFGRISHLGICRGRKYKRCRG